MSKTVFMRGLQHFIEDLRACQNKEQEEKRVDKELAKIREKFGDDKELSGYDKRKYVWKLLYIHMLGYNIDFGHRQACDLIPKPKYKDKQVGYMACAILLNENDEFLRLAINGVHLDLTSRNEAFECLALSFIGSVGGTEMAEALVPDIIKLLNNGATRPLVKKRAALCLLRMIRKTPVDQQVVNPDTFCVTMNSLLEERDMGLLLASVTLLSGMLARHGPVGYESCQSRLIRILERMTTAKEKDVPSEYLYYGIPSPWLQSRSLRALQFYSSPDLPADRVLLNSILQVIIDTSAASEGTKGTNPNKSNAMYSIMFEAIALALHLDTDHKLLATSVAALGKFLATKEPNIKYLTLETLSRLTIQPDILAAIRPHQPIVSAALRDVDVSIRKRAMDLLFTMCDASNASELVGELLQYLVTADFAMKEDLVLKIAILAEKHAPTVQWYVDTVLQLLERAGDFVSDDIWQRAVQLVTNTDSMQQYAARNIVEVLRRGSSHEALVCTAAYILGEYGRLIQAEVPAAEQFKLLHALLPTAGPTTKGLLMTAFIKIHLQDLQDEGLKRDVVAMFERLKRMMDADLQQRAAEYLALTDKPQAAAEKFVLPMPKWPERESTLLRQLQKREGIDDDAAAAASASGAGLASASSEDGTVSRAASSVPQQPLASPQPSVDLLGSEASGPAPAGDMANGDPFAAMVTSSAAVPTQPRSNNPMDLLADLFSDSALSPTAAAPGAAAAAVAPHATAPTAAPGQPPAAYSANPFNASFPPAAAAAAAVGPAADMFGAWPQPAAPAAVPAALGAQAAAPQFAAATPAAVQPFPAFPEPTAFPEPAAFPEAPAFGAASSGPALAYDDPFGDAAFGPPAPAAAAPPVHFEPPVISGDLQAWFSALLYKDHGILYDDQYLQVGVQTRYSNGTGEFMLFLGNKNAEHALQQFTITATSSASVQAVVAPAPAQMAPKLQVQVPITLTCLGPVVDVPTVHIGYVLGNVSLSQDLRVPVASHRFVVPDAAVAKEVFFDQWKQIGSSPPNKSQEMVSRETPLTSDSVMSVMRQANLGVEHGYLDPSPYNEAGAGYYMCGPPGHEQRALLMCRVEGNPQNMAQFRVTVVSALPLLSSSTKDLLVGLLKGLPA